MRRHENPAAATVVAMGSQTAGNTIHSSTHSTQSEACMTLRGDGPAFSLLPNHTPNCGA